MSTPFGSSLPPFIRQQDVYLQKLKAAAIYKMNVSIRQQGQLEDDIEQYNIIYGKRWFIQLPILIHVSILEILDFGGSNLMREFVFINCNLVWE